MSPIGRVFIVLNLLLAGAFVGFAGTYLQQANKWKHAHDGKVTELTKEKADREAARKNADEQINKQQAEKAVQDTNLANARNEIKSLQDEKKRLDATLTQLESDVKALNSSAAAGREETKMAFAQAKDAYEKAVAAQNAKDKAEREKDDATGKLRDANFKIAGLEENLKERDLKIASITKDNSEKQLLIDVAKVKGFLEGMAVPPLAGTVSFVSGRLVTISITENSTKAEVKPGYSFAIYEAGTYKGEARVTEAADGMVFCTVDKAKDGTTIKVGDRATTQTN
jgi:hypothetical protein